MNNLMIKKYKWERNCKIQIFLPKFMVKRKYFLATCCVVQKINNTRKKYKKLVSSKKIVNKQSETLKFKD